MRRSLGVEPGRLVLAVALALALWVLVHNEENPERADVSDFEVPIAVVNVPDGLTVVSEPQPVRVWARAPLRAWARLGPDSFRARADASQSRPGLNELRLEVDALDPEVRSSEARPATARVRLETVRERQVLVRVTTSGQVPLGYNTRPPESLPERVTVVGPESLVQQVDQAAVDVRIDGATLTINSTFAPRPIDGRGQDVKGVQVVPNLVTVTIPVSQQVAYKEVGVKPVVQGKPDLGYYLLPVDVEPASVTIVGQPDSIAGVGFLETEPIDVNGVSSSVVRRARLALPSGVSLLQPQTTIIVTARLEALEVSQTVRLRPAVEGLGPQLQIEGDLPIVELVVAGPAPSLQAMRPGDLRLTINLENSGPGRHRVVPTLAAPAGFRLQSMQPSVVEVELAVAEA